jgi:predicted permease
MDRLLPSLRYTIRLLLKSPGFTVTAILILGLGIGANTAIISLLNSVILKPLPYPDPNRLVAIFQPFKDFEWTDLDYPDYLDFCAEQHAFESLGVVHIDRFDLSGHGDAERLSGFYASASFLGLLRMTFLIGRPFTEDEDRFGGPSVVVLNERIWRRIFNADPKIIGTNVTLNDRIFEVVGVVSAQADEWTGQADLFVPISSKPGNWSELRAYHGFACFARLKQGLTCASAQEDLRVISNRLIGQYPSTNTGYGIRVVPLLDSMVSDYAATLWLLGAAVACLLLIASANTANLLFMRALARHKEMSIRAALGAGRLRLAIQLLLESVVLSVIAGVFGLLLSIWLIEIIKTLGPQDVLSRFRNVGLDMPTLIFSFGATLVISLLFGSLPALSLSKTSLEFLLREESTRGGSDGRQRQRIQSIFVIGQVSIAFILLIQAGLIGRSFQACQRSLKTSQ